MGGLDISIGHFDVTETYFLIFFTCYFQLAISDTNLTPHKQSKTNGLQRKYEVCLILSPIQLLPLNTVSLVNGTGRSQDSNRFSDSR